jgi:hypothetical protein
MVEQRGSNRLLKPLEPNLLRRDCEEKTKRWRIPIRGNYNKNFRSRNALAMTDTELKLMAALASIGLSSQPKMG